MNILVPHPDFARIPYICICMAVLLHAVLHYAHKEFPTIDKEMQL